MMEAVNYHFNQMKISTIPFILRKGPESAYPVFGLIDLKIRYQFSYVKAFNMTRESNVG